MAYGTTGFDALTYVAAPSRIAAPHQAPQAIDKIVDITE